MKNSNPGNGKHGSLAITRIFQPARIELELLAQVFELARRGSSHQRNAADLAESRSFRAIEQDARPEPNSLVTDGSHPVGNVARERVA